MLCKDLCEGMLLEIIDDKMCGWFNTLVTIQHHASFSNLPGMPTRFRIASDSVGLLMVTYGAKKIYKKHDTIMYLGTKQITSLQGKKSRQVRMIYIDGKTGYIEGYDVKYLQLQQIKR